MYHIFVEEVTSKSKMIINRQPPLLVVKGVKQHSFDIKRRCHHL